VEERKALETLKKDDEIRILPADKGKCLVILDKAEYQEKCSNLLEDKKTYSILGKRNPTTSFKTKILELLTSIEKEGGITKQQYRRLYTPPPKAEGRIETTSIGKASLLNNQFSSVFTSEDTGNIPNKCPSPHSSMESITITRPGVHKLLIGLKTAKASGPDEIPATILKETADDISSIIAFIFQQSLDTGQLPKDWKKANIAPIFKKGDRTKPVNYRPISLTCICCKLLEHIVVSSMMSHLDDYNILSNFQHGFRRRRSCETQLLITTEDIAAAVNKRKCTDLAILDFSKAFDRVPHQRLLHKLDYYGVRGQCHKWIASFLSNRSQRVLLDGTASNEAVVESGVPQGTVLGPGLFLVFISDIPDNISSHIRLFADDCLLYRVINSPADSTLLQQDLQRLDEWAKTWQMAFNVEKCYAMHITKNPSAKPTFNYTMDGTTLKYVNSNPYLGVHLDHRHSFGPHIQKISVKSTRLLNFLRRNMRKCPQKTKEKTYHALVRPGIEYCSPIWSPHRQGQTKQINQIEMVQRRAARFVLNKPHRKTQRDSVTAMLGQLGWTSLESRRIYHSLILFYKVLNRLVEVPLQYLPSPATRLTRRDHPLKFQLPTSNNNTHKNCFTSRTVRLWNQLPQDVALAPTLEAFKEGLLSVHPN